MVGENGHTGAHVVCAWGPVDVDECALRKDKEKTYLSQWMCECRCVVGDVDGW